MAIPSPLQAQIASLDDGLATEAVRLALYSLSVGYSQTPILHFENFELKPAEVVSIVGPSGVGKTTFFKTLTGELPPVSGTFNVEGQVLGLGLDRNFVARNIQGHPLLHWLTVRGNLELAARTRKVAPIDANKVLKEFAAEHLADRFPNTLSGGEKCRASLSHSLIGDPQLLLLDEPFVGLDPVVKEAVGQRIFNVARSRETSILLITHDLADAILYSDRVVVLGSDSPAGVVAEIDPAREGALEAIREALGTQS